MDELYLRPFPEGDGRWKVSVGGAELGRWAPDGSRLHWVDGDDRMMEAEVVTESAVRIGRPRELFRIEDYAESFDVAPDGRFLVIRDEPTGWRPDRVVVVVNWFEELRRLVPR